MKNRITTIRKVRAHRFLTFSFPLFVVLLTASCGNSVETKNGDIAVAEKTDSSVADTLSYIIEKKDKQSGDCSKKNGACLTLSIHHHVFDTRLHSSANVLNHFIEQSITGSSEENKKASISNWMLELEKMFQDESLADPEYMMSWSVEAHSEISFQNSSFISLSTSVYEFTGGAHPNSNIKHGSFRKSDGKRLLLSEIVNDSLAFTKEAEKHFRTSAGIPDDADLYDSGFDFGDEGFYLNSNFMLTEEGLYFSFNTYEIAPYAMGSFSFTVPYPAIENLLNEEFLVLIKKQS